MRRSILLIGVVASGCVLGGGDTNVCIDWDANGVNDCEPSSADTDDESGSGTGSDDGADDTAGGELGDPCSLLAAQYGLQVLWVDPGYWQQAEDGTYHPIGGSGVAWDEPHGSVAHMIYEDGPPWQWGWDFYAPQPEPFSDGLARLDPPPVEPGDEALTVRAPVNALEAGQAPGHPDYPPQTFQDLASGTLMGWVLQEGGGAEGQVTLRAATEDDGYGTETPWVWADVQDYGTGDLYTATVPVSPAEVHTYYWDFALRPTLRGTADSLEIDAALMGWAAELQPTYGHYSGGLFGENFQYAAFKPAMGYCLLN